MARNETVAGSTNVLDASPPKDWRKDPMKVNRDSGDVNVFWSELVMSLPVGVLVLDADGRVGICNDAARALLETEPQDREWKSVIETSFGNSLHYGADHWLHSGRCVNVALSTHPGEGRQVVILVDVTESVLLRNKLAHMERLGQTGKMMASLAHQLRTPLTTALLSCKGIEADLVSTSARTSFERVTDSLKRQERLIRNMLSFARGKTPPIQPVALQDLLDRLTTTLESHANNVPYRVIQEDISGDQLISGDVDIIADAIDNAAINAIEACRENGEVSIIVNHGVQTITFSVRDTGSGIREDAIKHLFEPFFTTRANGTGLGLAVSRANLSAVGGDITLVDNGNTGPTEFRVSLEKWKSNTGDLPCVGLVSAGELA